MCKYKNNPIQSFKRSPVFVLVLYSVFTIVFYFKINSKLPLVSHYNLSLLDKIVVCGWLIPELVLFGLIIRELAARGYKFLMWLIIGVFTSVYAVQYISLYVSFDLITPLGLENLNSLDLVVNKRFVRAVLRVTAVTLVFYGLWISVLKKSPPLTKLPVKIILSVSLILMFLIYVQNSNYFRYSKFGAFVWGAPPGVAMADSVLTYLFPKLKSNKTFFFKKF